MAIHADENLYPGINAHLNSYLQNETGGWASFHGEHITDIKRAIDNQLPAGYFTRSEKSLQIGEFDAGSGQEKRSSLRPDVTVFEHGKPINPQLSIAETASPVDTLPIPETLSEEDDLTGLIIYQAGEGGLLGRPITRIELLSPANKPSGSHYGRYTLKRTQTLKSGLRLVEIDYLHEYPPIIHNLKNYSISEEGAYPYTILVSDPRPTFEQGKTDIYGFYVADKIPTINIPLAGADVVTIDFNAIYHFTFNNGKFFIILVDYAQDPPELDKYSAVDKTFIEKHLRIIREKQSQ